MNRVHPRHPDHAAPADVVACTVVLDIHRAEIAGFPPEKLGNIDSLQQDGHQHGAADSRVALQLVLLEGIADDAHLPEHHAEATIRKLLHIPSENSWIKFGAPKIVDEDISIRTGVLRGRKVESLQHQTKAKNDSK